MNFARLSTPDVLDALDRGRDRGPIDRALVLLALAEGERDRARLLEVDVSARDRALFALRERVFGAELQMTATCPNCQERLESVLDIEALASAPRTEPAWTFEEGGVEVPLRLPNSGDLLAAGACTSEAEARALLLLRCVSAPVSEAVAARALDELGRRDACDVVLSLACATCGHGFQSAFDIASFLWTELEAWAELVLDEVHVLARAYGWREDEILALSPKRRRAYLERVLA